MLAAPIRQKELQTMFADARNIFYAPELFPSKKVWKSEIIHWMPENSKWCLLFHLQTRGESCANKRHPKKSTVIPRSVNDFHAVPTLNLSSGCGRSLVGHGS